MSGLISLREAATISGYHQDYLSFLIRKNKLHGEKIGRVWCVKEGDLQKFLLEKNNTDDKNLEKQRTNKHFTPRVSVMIFALVAIILLFVVMIQSNSSQQNMNLSKKGTGFVVNTVYSETSSEVSSQTTTKN